MTHIYSEHYSGIKKERNEATCINMDGSGNYHPKWNKSIKDKYHMIVLVYGF